MKIREMVGASVEMSLSSTHPHSAKKQLVGNGEKSKVIGACRYVPRPIVAAMLRKVQERTLPLGTDIGETPLAYGSEAIVYDYGELTDTPRVLKLYHSANNVNDTIKEHKYYQQLVCSALGSLVAPTSFFVYQSRYRTGQPRLGAVQEKVNGQCLFTGSNKARQSDLLQLQRGTLDMARQYELVPDFSGSRNILVTQTGDVKIIDFGSLIPVDKIDDTLMQREHMDWLATQTLSLRQSAP